MRYFLSLPSENLRWRGFESACASIVFSSFVVLLAIVDTDFLISKCWLIIANKDYAVNAAASMAIKSSSSVLITHAGVPLEMLADVPRQAAALALSLTMNPKNAS